MNLLTNAIDAFDDIYSSQSDLNLLPEIVIRTEILESDRIAIVIADNGPGIEESLLPRLFDPFFTTKPVGKGTGLGLAVSYQIVVEKHGGNLSCLSRQGTGTEFTIEIPTRKQITN